MEVDPFPKFVKRGEVDGTLQLLDSRSPVQIPAAAAAKAVQFLVDRPDSMTAQMAARLLSYDVSLIRAPAAEAWLKRARTEDSLIVDRIFAEEHPAVALAAYKGTVASWESCDDARRGLLASKMRERAASPVVAAVLVGQLLLIARKEYGGQTPPWPLFESVMPVAFRALPLGAYFRDERLYDVMRSSLGEISEQSLLEIIDRWIDLVEDIASDDVPSDFVLGVSDILVEGVVVGSPARGPRLHRILAVPGTAARIRVVTDLVDSWHLLSEQERNLLMAHLTAGKVDDVWLQAAALTRSDVPLEIETLLLPSGVTLSVPAEDVIARVSPDLLNACLQVFTGHNPVIYSVGAHGSGSSAWKAIVRQVARMPAQAMFDPAWEWLMVTNQASLLAKIVAELGPDQAERIVGLLLARKLRTSGEFLPEVWEALFKLPVSGSVKSGWIGRMAEIASTALDSIEEIDHWVPKLQQEEFLSYLATDLRLIQFLVELRRLHSEDEGLPLSEELATSATKLIALLIDKRSPVLWSTYDVVLRFLKVLKIGDEELVKDIRERRSKAIKAAHTRPPRLVQALDCWVGPS